MGDAIRERPSVKVDGDDLNAFQVDYFDDDEDNIDIAVHVDISEFHSGGEKSVCGEWISIPADEEIELEHGDESTWVTLVTVQFEERTPTLWFDRT